MREGGFVYEYLNSRMHPHLKIGDILKLKKLYEDSAQFGIIVDIHKAESLGEGGWISFDFLILNENGKLVHITETCIEKVL